MTNDAKARKGRPLCTGVLDYFPDALLAVAEVSRIGNDQHNPGEPLLWAKEKSTDEADSLMRHLADRGKRDTDGTRHSAKVAWRALALLQREIDADRDPPAHPVDHTWGLGWDDIAEAGEEARRALHRHTDEGQ
jgi:hypothetical protein